MANFWENLQLSFRLIDLVDVGIVALIVYRILLLIKGTRAMQMVFGLAILGIGFVASQRFELFTTHWILSYFTDHLVLIVIVLFQDDLRRALTHAGKTPFFQSVDVEEEKQMVDEIVIAAFRLARERIGALIVIERETGLKNFIDTGARIDANVRAELLFSIFLPSSPIHDGAAIITRSRVASASCFLPLSKDPNIDKRYGSRHRAALGISEETDAVVVLVSEETGEVHLVKNGKIATNLKEGDLKQSLAVLLDLSRRQAKISQKFSAWMRRGSTK